MQDAKINRKDRRLKILMVHNYYQQRGGEDVSADTEAELLRECKNVTVASERSEVATGHARGWDGN